MNSKATCRHCFVVRIMQLLWTLWFKALELRTHLESWVKFLVFNMHPDHRCSWHRWLGVGREIGWSASLCQLLAPTTLVEGLLCPRVRTRSQDHNLRIQRSRHLKWSMVTENISKNPCEQGAGHGQEGEEHETQKNCISGETCRGLCFVFRLLPFLLSWCEWFEKPGRGFENPSRRRPTTGELTSCIASNGRSMLLQHVPHPLWNIQKWKRISAFHINTWTANHSSDSLLMWSWDESFSPWRLWPGLKTFGCFPIP